jgi:hypothetical protein
MRVHQITAQVTGQLGLGHMLVQLFGCGTDYDTETKFVFEKFIAHLKIKYG